MTTILYRSTQALATIVLSAAIVFCMQAEQKSTDAGKKKAIVEAPAAPVGVKYDSGNRPDPFFNPNVLLKKKAADQDEEEPLGQAPPGIAGMLIANVKLLGTVHDDVSPTAVLFGTDRRSYFLKESDRLFDGYVKKIEADSVILIRETRLKSGKILTHEVTKRLRTP